MSEDPMSCTVDVGVHTVEDEGELAAAERGQMQEVSGRQVSSSSSGGHSRVEDEDEYRFQQEQGERTQKAHAYVQRVLKRHGKAYSVRFLVPFRDLDCPRRGNVCRMNNALFFFGQGYALCEVLFGHVRATVWSHRVLLPVSPSTA